MSQYFELNDLSFKIFSLSFFKRMGLLIVYTILSIHEIYKKNAFWTAIADFICFGNLLKYELIERLNIVMWTCIYIF